MDTSQLLQEAWKAVEESGVPESLQEVAFREAVEHLRSGEASVSGSGGRKGQAGDRAAGRKAPSPKKKDKPDGDGGIAPDEATFFSQLSEESGVEENDLRDVLNLSGSKVSVTPPTRKLGSNTSEQARTVIALVAGARSFGLLERPVDADAVRTELGRKGCYDPANFAAYHLGPLEGFNAGSDRTQIVTTSKWMKDFSAAVDQALGRSTDNGEK
jgi:hypothetical protein